MLCAKYQEAVVPEKNVTEIVLSQKFFVTATPTRKTQDDRSDPYMSPPLKRAGDTMTGGDIYVYQMGNFNP